MNPNHKIKSSLLIFFMMLVFYLKVSKFTNYLKKINNIL